MDREEFAERTMQFALRCLEVVDVLPATAKARVVADQLARASTSVAANYRAACRARSRADFIAKLGIVEEEADEVLFWLELIARAGLISERRVQPLTAECDQILALVVASIRTAKRNR
jgi:four helix bundle protein